MAQRCCLMKGKDWVCLLLLLLLLLIFLLLLLLLFLLFFLLSLLFLFEFWGFCTCFIAHNTKHWKCTFITKCSILDVAAVLDPPLAIWQKWWRWYQPRVWHFLIWKVQLKKFRNFVVIHKTNLMIKYQFWRDLLGGTEFTEKEINKLFSGNRCYS